MCILNQYCNTYVLVVSPTGSVRTLPNSLLTTAGDSVSFKCSADGGPDNTFYWRHNGEVLANETMSFLNVSAVTTDDLGLYTCVVTNIAGSGSSTSVIHGKCQLFCLFYNTSAVATFLSLRILIMCRNCPGSSYLDYIAYSTRTFVCVGCCESSLWNF